MRYPRQSPTTHTEQLGNEASIYDWARGQVHALNPTAARVWRQCDGATSPHAIAAALRVEMGIPEADAVVDLTLRQLARIHLMELPVEARGDRSATTRRWLLGRGVAAAMLPAIYSIVAPSPVDAQSLPATAPTLTSLSPNQGLVGSTVAVTLTGANFVIGATTVNVASGGVTAANVIVSSATSLTFNMVIEATATPGARTVTVTTAGGTSGGQTFTTNAPPPAPTLTSLSPNQGIRGATIPVTLIGANFIVGATTVAVTGGDVTVTNGVVSSGTSVSANFVLALSSLGGARTVTVTTAGGTSSSQTFTINLPLPGSQAFNFTGSEQTFTVPAGVVSLTIVATGAQGGVGFQALTGVGGLGGRTTATVSVTPSASLTVRVGGAGSNSNTPGGAFYGGGGSAGFGGGGGGASSVHNGAIPLVIAGGGGGGGGAENGEPVGGGNGGAGGGLVATAGATPPLGGGGGGGGTQAAGGAGGNGGETVPAADGTAGAAELGGTGGRDGSRVIGGGGGGGGYFGGGGGGGGNENQSGGGGGGGGSSFTASGAMGVVHQQGVNSGAGSVTITW